MDLKIISTNRKAYRNFHILQTWEAGIALVGSEVKSVRETHVNFKDSFATIESGEVFLYNLHINPYKQASYMNPEPDRKRKLLLHEKEIRKIEIAVNQKGLTLVPTKIYLNDRGFVKIELGLGKGKKLYDKREDVKKRSIDLALRRTLRVGKRGAR